VLNVG